MKPIKGFMCEKCGEIYTEEAIAKSCELEHMNFTELRITDASFNSYSDLRRDGDKKLGENRYIPQTLRVRYKEKEKTGFFEKSFVGYYELKKYQYQQDDPTDKEIVKC